MISVTKLDNIYITMHFTVNTKQKYNLPIFIEISPMAQVALLHTDINSGFKLAPRIGIKSTEKATLKYLHLAHL